MKAEADVVLVHPSRDTLLIASRRQIDTVSILFKSSSYNFSQKSRVKILSRNFGYTGYI